MMGDAHKGLVGTGDDGTGVFGPEPIDPKESCVREEVLLSARNRRGGTSISGRENQHFLGCVEHF
jgi:hypothetical protein